MCLGLLLYCLPCILIKDAPINRSVSVTNEWPATAAMEAKERERERESSLCITTIRKCASESFTRKVIYRWNWIVVKAGRCPVHLAKGWGRTNTWSWWMLCFLSFLSLLEPFTHRRHGSITEFFSYTWLMRFDYSFASAFLWQDFPLLINLPHLFFYHTPRRDLVCFERHTPHN